MTVVIPEK